MSLFEFLANNKPPNKLKQRVFAVNLSADSVFCVDDDLVKDASANWRLCLEWTEDYATSDRIHAAAEIMVEWRRHYGVVLSIDDVGSGMDGLLRITLTQPDILKIDGRFLKQAMCSLENKEILRDFIAPFLLKNITIVAEHIETPEHLAFAYSIGCNAWQGFWSKDSRMAHC